MASPNDSSSNIVSTRDIDLKRRIERLATLDERNLAQMTRILLKRIVDEKEKELGLPPMNGNAD
ncbi:hypothetical protein J0Q24_001158 [Vibrio cholerae]|uniref:hypothetical protein n=1 Tax=Vibrio cholerae TaxID=666 RepID=UPI001C23EE60|nr:hypothetical protein [Vibrio mimicus]EHE6947157.1 hypothetical protein [Vibrio cholerae]ELD8764129.1 hypothetical protein [Vibrio cholerae]ELJ8681790.1 hypothetical protein [Vibrio cholerae]ELT5927355.1 hypothetical protein [Vibrio cholerae]ELY5265501.1 hypothetical protein [Vibrio cholerae]